MINYKQVLIIFLILILWTTNATASSYVVYPTKDTSIGFSESGSLNGVNYGTYQYIIVSEHVDETDFNYSTLMEFQLPVLAVYSNVHLYLKAYDIDLNDTIYFYDITDRSWQESTVTYSTKPTMNITSFKTKIINTTNNSYYIDIDITDYANLNTDDGILSFEIKIPTTGGDAWFYSKEFAGTDSDPYISMDATAISATQTIYGQTYEYTNGAVHSINEVTIYIYNTTWSSYQFVDNAGIYSFNNLANDTYTIYATKLGYDTSPLSYVTINGTTVSNNILMTRYVSPYVPTFVYETIQIENIFGTAYVGSSIALYEGDNTDIYASGTTDSLGQAVFRVTKDQKYTLNITGGGLSGALTYTIYGKEEIYSITIVAGFPTGGDRYSDISTNLTVVNINATHKNLTLIYNDTTGSTSTVNFYATNLSTGTTCTLTSSADVVTLGCPVVSNGTYRFGFNATSTTYGFFKGDKIINFNVGLPNTPIVDTNVDTTILQWASIIILVVTAGMFGVTTLKFGAIIIPAEAMVLWVFGWFEPASGNSILSFTLLSTALILGVLIYMRMSEGKAAYT